MSSEVKSRTSVSSSNRENKILAILSIALGTLLGFIGVGTGFLRLLSFSINIPASTLYVLHPDIQYFGFLTLFILGVSYLLIPRFKNKRLDISPLTISAPFLIFTANLAWILTPINYRPVFTTIHLAADIFYTITVCRIMGMPAGRLASSEIYILLSPLLLDAAVIMKLYYELQGLGTPWWSTSYLQLSLLGFPTSMTYGVTVRTIRFRIGVLPRWRAIWVSLTLYIAGHWLAIASQWLDMHPTIPSAVFLVSGTAFIAGVEGFKMIRSGRGLDQMDERDRIRYQYFSTILSIGFIWLIAGLLSGLTLAFASLHWLRDIHIHSITIGFIANMIMAYAPILLPPLISLRTPFRSLTPLPAYLVNIGQLLRVLGMLFSPTLVSFSGIPLIAGLGTFLVMVHRLGGGG
jgi:hypothetical protein